MTDLFNIFVFNDDIERINLVKSMHNIVTQFNDEEPYYKHWLSIMPDEPDEQDFVDIATDDHLLADLIDTFGRIINQYIVKPIAKQLL